MVDFTDDNDTAKSSTPSPVPEGGKQRAEFFAQVRERGILNASLDMLAQEYEASHPGEKAKWEYYDPNRSGGTDIVVSREALEYKVVEAGEIPSLAKSSQKEGPIRRGDLVLMACPLETWNLQRLQDAQAANDDLQAPRRAFEENVGKNVVQLSSGESRAADTFGSIKRTTEEVPVTLAKDS